MTKRRQIITVFVWALVACAVSHADMVPLSAVDAARRQPQPACAPVELRHATLSSLLADFAGVADLDSLLLGFSCQPTTEAGQPGKTKPVCILVDRQNSLALCLYALFGLGLCKSAPWVKRLSLAVIPEWYHSGGPWQIGHSFAISPECQCPAAVCFVQPEALATDLLPPYDRGMIASLWRESQFLSALLGSRGPPEPTMRMASCVPSVA